MRLKLLQKEQFKKAAEATGDLISNKIVDKSTKISENLLQQNNLQMSMINKYIKKDICPERRQEIIDDLRLK